MNAKVLAFVTIPGSLILLSGCGGVVYVGRPHPRTVVVAEPAPVVYQQPTVVVQPAPTYVEEGGVFGGVVVAAPASVDDYVFVNGGWYYWHPGLRVWVHANRPGGWHPGPNVHVYASWGEHPVYRAHPVVVAPAPAPVVVARPAPVVVAPTYVEEGAVVGGVVVAAPAGVDGYVFVNGGWFYWHPGLRVWVHANRPGGWRPGPNVHVYASWSEHPMYRR